MYDKEKGLFEAFVAEQVEPPRTAQDDRQARAFRPAAAGMLLNQAQTRPWPPTSTGRSTRARS